MAWRQAGYAHPLTCIIESVVQEAVLSATLMHGLFLSS